jgi:hypothetical protein
MAVAVWYGSSWRKPKVTRFRDEDGWYGLHVVCWHGVQADLVYPVKETIESWEYSVSLLPCSWINCGVKDVRRRQSPSQGPQGGGAGAVERFWSSLDDDGDG